MMQETREQKDLWICAKIMKSLMEEGIVRGALAHWGPGTVMDTRHTLSEEWMARLARLRKQFLGWVKHNIWSNKGPGKSSRPEILSSRLTSPFGVYGCISENSWIPWNWVMFCLSFLGALGSQFSVDFQRKPLPLSKGYWSSLILSSNTWLYSRLHSQLVNKVGTKSEFSLVVSSSFHHT